MAIIVLGAMNIYWLKPIAFSVVLAFSLSQEIIMWDSLILSESLAISILALYLALGIWLTTGLKPYKFLLLAMAAILLIFTRDAFSYTLLMSASVLLAFAFPSRNRYFAYLSGFFLILFIASSVLINIGDRWLASFINVVGRRVLPNPEYIVYFEKRGMPVTDPLMELSGELVYGKDLAFLLDPRLEEFRQWVKQNGLREYARFLWFYKADTLQDPIEDIRSIVTPDIYYYAATGFRPIITQTRLRDILYPIRFGVFMFFAANCLAFALIFPAYHFRQGKWVVPLLMVLFSYPHSVLIWHADSYEIGRHSLYHNIEWRLGSWLIVLFVVDFIFAKLARRPDKK